MQIQRIPVRNLRFDTGSSVPRYWHGAGRSVSIFFNNLSIFFPHGERFFIKSVRHHLPLVDEPWLREMARDFCGQEAMHTREHKRYNAMLTQQGYPAEEMEARVERILALVEQYAPKRWQLAITCALEHYTALLGHVVLNDPTLFEEANTEMAALWAWHAAEETEHKAVAFDVYEMVGAPYVERVGVMMVASLIFWGIVFVQQAELMAVDGIARDPREWWKLTKFLFVEPNRLTSLIGPTLEYLRSDFHPWDQDNSELLRAWCERLDAESIAA